MSHAITPTNPGSTTIEIASPQDIKYWEAVQRVRAELSRDCNTTRKACEQAGISHHYYYDALKSPYVQSQLVEQFRGLRDAVHEVVERGYVQVVMNMMNIAASSKSKEAVQAGRLARELYQDVQRQVESLEKPSDADHPATVLLNAYMKPRKLRRTVVTEEIDLEDH